LINIYDLFERKKNRRIYPYGALLIDTITRRIYPYGGLLIDTITRRIYPYGGLLIDTITRRIYPYGGLLIDTISFIRNKVDTICNYILIVKWRTTLCTAWYNCIEFTWSFSCTSLTENNYCLQQVLLLYRICLRDWH
jgi:hypothetical protein